MTDFEERPAKKRRFFVEDSPEPQFLPQPQEQSPLPQRHRKDGPPDERDRGDELETGNQTADEDGFDSQLFEAFVGEKMHGEDLGRLKSMAGNDTQRGRLTRCTGMIVVLMYLSYQHVPRRILSKDKSTAQTQVKLIFLHSNIRAPSLEVHAREEIPRSFWCSMLVYKERNQSHQLGGHYSHR